MMIHVKHSIYWFKCVSFESALEKLLNFVGAAASILRARIKLNYRISEDAFGRRFSGLHDTVLPLASTARTIFQQLRKRTGISRKKKSNEGENEGAEAAPKINGSPLGRITGVDMRHLLLLLPFLLFDLLHDEADDHNEKYGTSFSSPANDLIALVLVLFDWYRLYRLSRIMSKKLILKAVAFTAINVY